MPDPTRPAGPTGPTGPTAPTAPTAPTGRARLWHALGHPSRGQVVVGVLLALVGFAGVTQLRTTGEDSTYAGLREQDLIDVLNGLSGTTQRTQAEIDRLTRARADLLDESTSREAALREAQEEVDRLNVLAGLVPVTGPGIRATITEKSGTLSISSMLDVVQELRSVGAEAIQLNGTVRVIASTSFEEGVGGLEVDGTLVESPYVVDAIGPPGALASSLTFPLGPREQVELDGAEIAVEELTSLDIDTVREREQPDFAEPDS